MDSAIEAVANLSRIRGEAFHTPKNRPLPRVSFEEDGFSRKPGQEAEERISGNKVALFGLWLRGLPEWLHRRGFELWVSSVGCFSGLKKWTYSSSSVDQPLR
jgi:hypothetical protein